MPTPTKTPDGATHPLLQRYGKLQQDYSNSFGAAKAVAARRISETAVELRLAGVEYEPWQRPNDYTRKYELSPEQLMTRARALRQLVADHSVEEPTRAAADRQLAKLVEQAEKRGIEIS